MKYLLTRIDQVLFCATETRLDSTIYSAEIFPKGNTVYRRDRGAGALGGGVLLATSDNLITSSVDNEHGGEVVWTETRVQGCRPLLVGVFYRPPNDINGETIANLSESIQGLGNKLNTHNI